MKYILLAIIMFTLPHVNWLPRELNIHPDQVPLGLSNIIYILAVALIFTSMSNFTGRKNHLILYKWYLVIICLSFIASILTSYESIVITATLFKQQLLLLLMFYVSFLSIKDEVEFKKLFYISLVIHIIIGFEVMRSGVLGGSSFHDGKRGSGPFSEGLAGSDVAGSYLAQVLMFLCAILISFNLKLYQRAAVFLCSIVMVFGIYATYARGALLATMFGIVAMLPYFGLKLKYLMLISFFIVMGLMLAPDSITTRFDDTKTDSGEYDESTQGRFFYWNSALEIIKENPLGVGVGQVRGAMQSKIGKHVDPHNGFLYTACEYGIIGLIVFILMLIQMYKYSLQIWKDVSLPSIYRTYALGMGGFLGSFVVCNMFYANFYKDLVMGTIAIHFGMLAFILADIAKKEELKAL